MYLLYVTRENEQTNVYSVLGTTVPLMYPVHNLSPFELVKLNVSASTIAGEGPQSPEIQNRTAQTGIYILYYYYYLYILYTPLWFI